MSYVQEVYKLVENRKMWRVVSYTREKQDWAWRTFWDLLISSGFEFEKKDLIQLRSWSDESGGFSPYRSWHPPQENHYNAAVHNGNMSFAHAYEEYMGRKPFITTGINYGYSQYGYTLHATSLKTQGRLVVGAEFSWQGKTVKVTSFDDVAHSLIACAYQPRKEGEYSSKIKKRFRITVEDLRMARKVTDAGL